MISGFVILYERLGARPRRLRPLPGRPALPGLLAQPDRRCRPLRAHQRHGAQSKTFARRLSGERQHAPEVVRCRPRLRRLLVALGRAALSTCSIAILVLVGVTYGRVLVFAGVWLAAALGAELLGDQRLNEIVMPRLRAVLRRRHGPLPHPQAGSAWLRGSRRRPAGPWRCTPHSTGCTRIEAAGFKNMPVTDLSVIITIR